MKKNPKKKEKPDFELIVLPSQLPRMKKSELILELKFMIEISNRILENQAKQKLISLEKDIIIKTQNSKSIAMETRIFQLEEKIEKQVSRHTTELKKASEDFVCFGRC